MAREKSVYDIVDEHTFDSALTAVKELYETETIKS